MPAQTRYTKDFLEPIVSSSRTMVEILEKVKVSQSNGNRTTIRRWCLKYKLDLSHLGGKNWAKGKTKKTCDSINRVANSARIPDDEVFKVNGHLLQSHKIKKRLLESGWENKCKECGLTEWLGKPIALHLDHINGNPCDNRKENLRILCPNCHQQTDTWGNRKRACGEIGSTHEF